MQELLLTAASDTTAFTYSTGATANTKNGLAADEVNLTIAVAASYVVKTMLHSATFT